MSTNQQDLMDRLNARVRARARLRQGLGAAMVPGIPDTVADRLGLVQQDVLAERSDGPVESFAKGAVFGLLEPLSLVPGVDEFLDRHVGLESPHVGQKVGYALGSVAGFFVPGTAALKATAAGMKGLKLIKTADAFTDLGFKMNAIRGAGAGGLLGAGGTDERENLVRNTVTGATIGSVAEVAMFPIMRGISAAYGGAKNKVFGESGKALSSAVDGGAITTFDGAEAAGRALNIADELFPAGSMVGTTMTARREILLNGLDRLGLDKMETGQVRVWQTLDNDAEYAKSLLKKMDDVVEFTEVKVPGRKAGTTKTDILVTPKGELDPRLAAIYSGNADRTGRAWIPGQKAVYNGQERIIVGPSTKKGWVKAITVGSTKKAFPMYVGPAKKGLPAPASFRGFMNARLGPSTIKNSGALWGDFVGKHTLFPEGDWPTLAREYIRDNAGDITGAQADELTEFFAKRQLQSIYDLEEELGSVMKGLAGRGDPGALHPDGELRKAAAAQGYVVDAARGEKGEKLTVLRDVLAQTPTVGKEIPFIGDDVAMEFLRMNSRDLPDLVIPEMGFGVPYQHIDLGEGGPVQLAHTAMTLKNVDMPRMYNAAVQSVIFPRAAFFRNIDNAFIEATGQPLGVHSVFDKLQRGLTIMRNSTQEHFKEITKIRGGLGAGKMSEAGKREGVELWKMPRSEWTRGVLDELGMTSDDALRLTQLDDFMEKGPWAALKREGIVDVSWRDYMENYYHWVQNIDPASRGKVIRDAVPDASEKMIRFVDDMERVGQVTAYDLDPFLMATRYTRSAFTRINLQDTFIEANRFIKNIPDGVSSELDLVKSTLKDYVSLSYGQAPEAYYVMRVAMSGIMEDLGIHLGKGDADRLVNTVASLNYGAFMGFRPGLAMRNLTQTMAVTLPLIQSPRHMKEGFKFALSDVGGPTAAKWMKRFGMEGVDIPGGPGLAQREGAINLGSGAAPLQDAIFFESIFNNVPQGAGLVGKGIKKLENASAVGLGSKKATLFGKEFQVGFYTKADEFNRAVAFGAQRSKTQAALNKFRHGELDVPGFNGESGLDIFGDVQTQEFHRMLATEGDEAAINWLGVQAANETQWIYQLGAGPAWMSHGVGRLVGMYGTWPSWYLAHLARGAKIASPRAKTNFFLWTGAVVGATGAVTKAGLNISRWSPLQSLNWVPGGPFMDYFTDFSDIWTGSVGGEPTAGRQLALSKFGARDRGNARVGGVPIPQGLDPRRGRGIDIVDPLKTVKSLFAPITPGALFLKDMNDAWGQAKRGDLWHAITEAAGIPSPAGLNWPKGRF